MANLVIPRRGIWTEQPTEFVPLANWINKGQSRVFNPAFGAVDVATGKPLTLVGANPLISPVSAGLAFDTNAAACRYEIPLRAGDGIYQAKQYIVFAQFELTFVGSGPYGGPVVELSAGYGKQIYIGTSPNYTQSKRVSCFIRPNNQSQNYVRTLDAGSNTEIVTVAIFCKTGFSPEFFAKGDGWTDYYKLPTAITNAADTFDKLTFCGSSYDAIDLSFARKITLGGVLAQPDVSAAMAMALVQNPWQIFAPRETRLFVPVSSIGGSYTLTAQAGIYSLTGQPAQLLKSKLLTSSGGTYQHVGVDASLYRSKQLSLSGGSYSTSSTSADITFTGLSANYQLTAQGGSYNLVGSSTDITYTALSPSYLLTAQGGTYTLSGNSIGLRKSKRVTASGGVYSYTGQQVNITAGPVVVSTLVKYINVLTGEILLLQPF